jgi:hypothetical protein
MMDADPEGFKLEEEDLPYWAYDCLELICFEVAAAPAKRPMRRALAS